VSWRALKHYHISHQGSSVLSNWPKACQGLYLYPHGQIEQLSLHWPFSKATGRASHYDRTRHPWVRSQDTCHVSLCVQRWPPRPDAVARVCSRAIKPTTGRTGAVTWHGTTRSQVNSKNYPERVLHDLSCPVIGDRTQASVRSPPTVPEPPRHKDRTLNGESLASSHLLRQSPVTPDTYAHAWYTDRTRRSRVRSPSAPLLTPGTLTGRACPESGPMSGQHQWPLSLPFLHRVDHHQRMCQRHQVYTTMCMCVSIFTIIFKELDTQLVTPLDPSNDAKLDHSSGTRWPICKQVCPSW
jgi:hypothetical protein